MRIPDLASRLVSARTDAERNRLVRSHPIPAVSPLARQIKEICYASWATDPKKAQGAAKAMRILARFSPDAETKAFAAWVEGIADLTQGRFGSAVKNLRISARRFRRLQLSGEAAQTQVAELVALAHMGRYADADRIGRLALGVFESIGDQLAAGKIQMNLSNIAARRELHAEAERYCRAALRRFRKIGADDWQTMAENGLANTFAEINDFRKAEKFYSMALETARRAGLRVTIAEIEASMGNLATFRGRFADALKLLEMSRQRFDQLGMPHRSAVAELEIADVYAQLDLIDEAAAAFKKLVPVLRRLGLRFEEARAHFRYGQIAAAAGNLRLAVRELDAAENIYKSERNRLGRERVRLELARVLLNKGELSKARNFANRILRGAASGGNRRSHLTARWLRAEIDRKSGRTHSARRELLAVCKAAKQAESVELTVAALNSVGKAHLALGERRRARRAFEAAANSIEGQRSPIASDDIRMAFLAGRMEPFEHLVRLALVENDIEGAFAYVERARARSLTEAIGNEIVAGDIDGKLAGRLNKVREELNWFYSRLSRADTADTRKIDKEIVLRERAIAEITRQIDSTATVRTTAPRRFETRHLKDALGSDTALVEFIRSGETYSAFVIAGSKIEYFPDLISDAELGSLLERLHFQFATFRLGDAVSVFADDLKRRTDAYLDRLHTRLFAPLLKTIGDRDVVVAPAGALNYIPFPALRDASGYEVEKRVIRNAPSAAVWLALQQRADTEFRGVLLAGYADEKIPFAEKEIRSIARQFPGAEVLTGRNATFGRFLASAPAARLIHLACHGQFRTDNPMFSSLHLADGWVTVRDICRQRLAAALVTLSACETGLSGLVSGEEIVGLIRGFLSAGAGAMVVSLWTVNDAAATRLMKGFYRELEPGRTVSAALTAAQRDFVRRGVHPYYWSPFITVGP